jgi:hypothetical protein
MPRQYTRWTAHEHILNHIQIGNGCWEWGGTKDVRGYGKIQMSSDGKQRTTGAHRVVYEYVLGPIPEGLELDHLCRNPSCVRPDHLEPVTHAENLRRASPYIRWTHCAKGHLLAGDNLSPASNGTFRCKVCKRERSHLDRAANKESGRCKCGRRLEDGHKCCVKCRESALAYWRRRNEEPCPPKQ